MARATLFCPRAGELWHVQSAQLGPRTDVRPSIAAARVAGKQLGLITRQQARGCGLSDGAINYHLQHGWDRLYRSVFLLPGFERSWSQRVLALCMRGGPGTVASHTTAAFLHGLEGFGPVGDVHLYGRSSWKENGVVVHRTQQLPDCDVERKGPMPLTAISRTLLDLGAAAGEEQVEIALEFALRHRLTSVPRLRWRLDQVGGRGHPGSAVLRKLLDLRDPGTRPAASVLEVRFIRGLRGRRLPTPVRQHEVRVGKRRRYIDFAFPHARVGVEVGGRRFHSGPAAEQRDSIRHNELTALGWRLLYFTWDDVDRRLDHIIESIERELRRTLF